MTPVALLAVHPRPHCPSVTRERGELDASGEIDLAIGAISVSDKDPISIDTFNIDTFA